MIQATVIQNRLREPQNQRQEYRMSVKLIFLVVAIILFVLQALGISSPKVSTGWIGMAFFAAAFIV
jgi:fatty acid desaturase